MLRSLRLSSLVVAIPLALLACRDSSGDDDDDGPDAAIDAPGVEGVTIQEVQNDAMVPGTPVELRGVVVVHIDTYGARVGNFYVMEPAGGEFSGLLVFGAPVEQVALLAPGDLVDIVGAEKDEFGLDTDDSTVTELVPVTGGVMTVTKTGTAPIPAPHVLDALAVGQMATAAREAEYEKWEGVLLEVRNVSVIRGLQQIGSTDPDFRGFLVTGQLGVDSSLAAIPPTHVAARDCLTSVTGMGDYFFDYKVLPRTTADIVTGGTGCPPPEDTMLLCGDTIDNDANGFVDCMDNGCRALSSCQVTTTVASIQNGTVPVNTTVSLANVVVTALSANGKNLWIADAAAAAQFGGVAVFRGNAAAVTPLPAEIVVGARVNVTGTVLEFNSGGGTGTLTQIGTSPTVTFVPGALVVPTAITGVSVATLTTDATGEPYEGVLVEITNVRVTTAVDSFGVRDFTAGAAMFVSDDDISAPPTDADGTCYSLIRGVWSYNVFEDRWAILPLGGATNTMTGGTCN